MCRTSRVANALSIGPRPKVVPDCGGAERAVTLTARTSARCDRCAVHGATGGAKIRALGRGQRETVSTVIDMVTRTS